MRIAEAFCKMRLSEYCSSIDIDRAIAVTVDSFVGSQKVSCKKALSRAFAKYVQSLHVHHFLLAWVRTNLSAQVHTRQTQAAVQAPCGYPRVAGYLGCPLIGPSVVPVVL